MLQFCRRLCTTTTNSGLKEHSIGLMFPGQGSQHIGMGHDLYKNFPVAKDVFDQVDEILNYNLSKLIFHGDETELKMTSNAQPAILTHSLATLAVIQSESDVFDHTHIVMGHSLGEFTAACAAGYMNLADGVKIVRARGVAMEASASQAGETLMVAMMPLSYEKSQLLCERVIEESNNPNSSIYGMVCEVANWNATNQVVISGNKDAIQLAITLGKEEFQVRRAIPLDVSAPFHCSLLHSVEQEVKCLLNNNNCRTSTKNKPQMITNIDGTLQNNWNNIRSDLSKQTCKTVKWVRCMDTAINQTDTETWYEVGPGVTLSTLMKRHVPKHYQVWSSNDLIKQFLSSGKED
jgi:[acyl-carrier-protein] S-malonyltransferase